MAIFKSLFVIATVCATLVFAEKKYKILILDYAVTVDPNNPFYGDWKAVIGQNGETFSMKTPIKADITEELNFQSIIKVGGEQVMKVESSLCEMLKNPEAVEMAMKYGRPVGKYAIVSACPIKKCDDCELVDAQFDENTIPPGTPAMDVDQETVIFKDNAEKPYIKMMSRIRLEPIG